MIRDVEKLKYIRELDSGQKMKPRDLIRATAARVGLGVPQVRHLLSFQQSCQCD